MGLDMTPKRRICLFGTSGDPPTGVGGHWTIVQTLSLLKFPSETHKAAVATTTKRQIQHQQQQDDNNNNKWDDDSHDVDRKESITFYFDQIWVLPVYQHMYSVRELIFNLYIYIYFYKVINLDTLTTQTLLYIYFLFPFIGSIYIYICTNIPRVKEVIKQVFIIDLKCVV